MAVLLAGCGGPTAKLEQSHIDEFHNAFASAEGGVKTEIDRAVERFRADDVSAGMLAIKAALAEGEFTTEQKNATYDFIAQVQKVMAERPEKYPEEVHTTIRHVTNIMQGLPENTGADYGRRQPPPPNQP